MQLSPDEKYWFGWVVFGLVSLGLEWVVVYTAVVRAMQTVIQR